MTGVLCDADYLIALFFAEEPTHAEAKKLHRRMDGAKAHMLNLVLYEVATVVSRKYGNPVAVEAVHALVASDVHRVNVTDWEDEAWQEFTSHAGRRISFTDCANIVAARKYSWKIASFDKFYPKELLAA